jgi:hypothetical protein
MGTPEFLIRCNHDVELVLLRNTTSNVLSSGFLDSRKSFNRLLVLRVSLLLGSSRMS